MFKAFKLAGFDVNYMEKKKLPGQTCTYFQCIFCNSFVTYFILTRMHVIRTLQIRIKIMLN